MNNVKQSPLLDGDWLQRLEQCTLLYVAYSGGLDSTVLLTYLSRQPSLVDKLQVIHVHHGISPNADDWVLHCEQQCQQLGLRLHVRHVQIQSGANLEERARLARHQVFESLLQEKDAVVLAHHQNDQSETLLLHLLRGAGVDGLSAMPEQRACGQGLLLRPFLSQPRERLLAYAKAHHLQWIEDESNYSDQWSRSYLRHQVMPVIQAKWPSAVTNIASAAQHCRQARDNLDALAHIDCKQLHATSLALTADDVADRSRLCNRLRVWIKYHTGQAPSAPVLRSVIENVILAREDASPLVKVHAFHIRRYRQSLYIMPHQMSQPLVAKQWHHFPDPLMLSEQVCLIATKSRGGVPVPQHSRIEIKYRRGGETLSVRGHRKSLKNVFQEWHIPPWQRDQIPLLFVDEQLLAVIGYTKASSDAQEGYIFSIDDRSQSAAYDPTFN